MLGSQTLTLLGKLVWDIHTDADNLWFHIVRNKYLGDLNILETPQKNDSIIWNSIMNTRNVLKDGYVFQLGNGNSYVCYSPLTTYGKLSSSVFFVDIQYTDLCIKDLIHDWG